MNECTTLKSEGMALWANGTVPFIENDEDLFRVLVGFLLRKGSWKLVSYIIIFDFLYIKTIYYLELLSFTSKLSSSSRSAL